jgi:hypothetical protein
MSTAEQRAMQMLGVTEEVFEKIQEAHKLFRGLWDDDAFVELWKSIPDDACSALFYAVEVIARKDEEARETGRKIYQLHQTIHTCADRLVHEYAENGSEATKEVGIAAVGEREFFALLLEGGYDLNEYDREDIASLLR